MKKALILFLALTLTACAPQQVTVTSQVTVTLPPPTETPTVTASATPSPESLLPEVVVENEYKKTLDEAQRAVYEQSKDMTAEGFTRKFLTEADLSSYLAYYDKAGEVAYVWNPEQNKINPALKIENNLFINENSGNHIVWNPEMDRETAKKTLANYMKYVRAQTCALSNGGDLPNTLEKALADENAQKYLDEGCNVLLRGKKTRGSGIKYDVPQQSIYLDGSMSIVIKFVNKPNDNMFFIDKADGYLGMSFNQKTNNPLNAEYYNEGSEILNNYAEFKDMLFSQRIGRLFQHLFNRANRSSDLDTVTQSTIFNQMSLETKPLVTYARNR